MPSRDTVIVVLFSVLAIYFAATGLWPLFPPPDVTKDGRFIFLLLGVFFFLVPVAEKVEIFQFLSFERRLKDADRKIDQQREEIKHLQSIQATLTSSLTSITTPKRGAEHRLP